MKATRMVLAAGLLALAVAALATDVTTTPIKILPERNVNVRQLDYWVEETEVAQGQLMRWGNNAYWVVTAGTTTNIPPTFTSGSETNGTAILRYIKPGARRGFVVQLHDDGPIWARAYAAPEMGDDGFVLSGELALWSESGDGVPQGAIYVTAETGTNQVSATEW